MNLSELGLGRPAFRIQMIELKQRAESIMSMGYFGRPRVSMSEIPVGMPKASDTAWAVLASILG